MIDNIWILFWQTIQITEEEGFFSWLFKQISTTGLDISRGKGEGLHSSTATPSSLTKQNHPHHVECSSFFFPPADPGAWSYNNSFIPFQFLSAQPLCEIPALRHIISWQFTSRVNSINRNTTHSHISGVYAVLEHMIYISYIMAKFLIQNFLSLNY